MLLLKKAGRIVSAKHPTKERRFGRICWFLAGFCVYWFPVYCGGIDLVCIYETTVQWSCNFRCDFYCMGNIRHNVLLHNRALHWYLRWSEGNGGVTMNFTPKVLPNLLAVFCLYIIYLFIGFIQATTDYLQINFFIQTALFILIISLLIHLIMVLHNRD